MLVWHVSTAWLEGAEDLCQDRRVLASALPSANAPVWNSGWHNMFCFGWRAVAERANIPSLSGMLTGVLKASRELMCFKGIANQLSRPVCLRLLPFEVGYFASTSSTVTS